MTQQARPVGCGSARRASKTSFAFKPMIATAIKPAMTLVVHGATACTMRPREAASRTPAERPRGQVRLNTTAQDEQSVRRAGAADENDGDRRHDGEAWSEPPRHGIEPILTKPSMTICPARVAVK
jgi:hypothetical protein